MAKGCTTSRERSNRPGLAFGGPVSGTGTSFAGGAAHATGIHSTCLHGSVTTYAAILHLITTPIITIVAAIPGLTNAVRTHTTIASRDIYKHTVESTG